MRKAPRQDRAGHTIAMIYEAAAQILQREGESNFNTNRIAELAGVSIGTLYQYFPNKDAILLALAEREAMELLVSARKTLLKTDPKTAEETVREVLRVCIRAFSGRQRLRRAIVASRLRALRHFADDHAIQRELGALVLEVRKRRDARRAEPELRPVSEAALFVIFRAVGGVLRSAVLEESPLLGTLAFEDELVHLVMGMLRK